MHLRTRPRRFALLVSALLLASGAHAAQPAANHRPPTSEADLRFWLENMIWHHGFDRAEIEAATGLTAPQIEAAAKRFAISPQTRPPLEAGAPLRVLPYPGGRHPRIGFLEGAIDPQRETKFSVFTPWDPASYVVVDLPEAIWSNLGLTYLAHTHIDTIWTTRGITLPRLEWKREASGALHLERDMPGGISYTATVQPTRERVWMRLSLTNGTDEPLTDLRVQICAMLKGAAGFEGQTQANKVLRAPLAICRGAGTNRWIITAWDQCHNAWANERCPCLHSDPKFPDCAPGQTQQLVGWLAFYEGDDLDGELARLEQGAPP